MHQFQALQYAFTAHIRDPENCPGPADVEDRRLGIYRELLYNNVEGFLAKSFPVLRSISSDLDWHARVRDYFAHHRARTPYFPKLAQEFLHYLAATDLSARDPVFIRELAHYEWLELEAMLDTREISDAAIDQSASCLRDIPVLNPIARVHAYSFLVHRISPDFQPEAPSDVPTYLVVYRDPDDDVGFMELNPITARLVELIMQNTECSGQDLLEQIAIELQHPNPDVVVAGGAQIMDELRGRHVLLGAKVKPESATT